MNIVIIFCTKWTSSIWYLEPFYFFPWQIWQASWLLLDDLIIVLIVLCLYRQCYFLCCLFKPRIHVKITLLHFAWVVDDTKCIVVTRACVSMCVYICLSAAACPHYCTDPDVTWRSGRGCPLVVHCWADLQSVHGLRCYGNITRTLVITSLITRLWWYDICRHIHPAIWRHSANAKC